MTETSDNSADNQSQARISVVYNKNWHLSLMTSFVKHPLVNMRNSYLDMEVHEITCPRVQYHTIFNLHCKQHIYKRFMMHFHIYILLKFTNYTNVVYGHLMSRQTFSYPTVFICWFEDRSCMDDFHRAFLYLQLNHLKCLQNYCDCCL